MMKQRDEATSQQHLEQELQDAIARYEAILASTVDPVITIDAFGTIQAASDSAQAVFGWTPDELKGQNINVLMPEPHNSQHDGYLANYRETGDTGILNRLREFEAVRKDGRRVPIEISVSRVDIPGQPHPLFTGIIRDISERKTGQEELRRNREHLEELVAERSRELEASHEQLRLADRLASIGTLAAGLGHDMNNVLLPLRCRLDALNAADLPAPARLHFEEVGKSVQYLQQLADGLHLLSLDPENAEVSAEGTDISEWWEQVGPLLARGLPRHVRLETTWPGDLPRVGVAPHRLTQALLNLVINAGEAVGDDGTVRIWAEMPEDKSSVQLGVIDNGHGMTTEVKRRALDPFFTTKKRGLGTGLGLSLVQGVVRSAGGTMRIDSEPGKGTTIVMTLPIHGVELADQRRIDGSLGAVVSVTDERLASLVSTLLETAGFILQGDDDLDASRLWVTEPSAIERARSFLSHPDRGVLVLGPGSQQWRMPGVVVVEDPEDFESLREKISQVFSSLTGAPR